MSPVEILFDVKGRSISPNDISERITAFSEGYSNTVKGIIFNSKVLDDDGEVFIKCASLILSNFGKTRSGPFHEVVKNYEAAGMQMDLP